MNDWKVVVHWAEGDETYELNECSITEAVGAKMEHATQSAKITIAKSTRSVTMHVLQQAKDYEADIYNGTELMFSGVISRGWDVSAKLCNVDSVELTIDDMTTKLHKYVYSAEVLEKASDKTGLVEVEAWASKKVCDPDDLENSLTHILLGKGGFTDIVCDAADLSVVPYLKLEEGDYVDETLAELLYEYGLDFIFEGRTARIVSTDPTRDPSITVSEFRKTFSSKGSLEKSDGVEIEYYKYRTERAQLARISYKPLLVSSFGSASGEFEGDATWDLEDFEDKYDDFELVGLSNVSCAPNPEDIDNSGVQITSWDEEGCHFKGQLWGNYKNYWWSNPRVVIKFYGDVTFRTSGTFKQYVYGNDPKSKDFKFLQDNAGLIAAAARIANAQKFGGITYTFYAFEKYPLSAVVKMQENSLINFEGNARIIQRVYDATLGMYSYKAEGVGNVVTTKDIATTEKEEHIQQEPETYLDLSASRDRISDKESAAEAVVTITATGTAFDKYMLSPTWTINDAALSSHDQKIEVQRSQLSAGLNVITCTVKDTDGTGATKSVAVEFIAEGVRMEWTTWPDSDIPPVETGWSATYPTAIEDGWSVWQRVRTDSSDWAYSVLPAVRILTLTASSTQWHFNNRGEYVTGQQITLTASLSSPVSKDLYPITCQWTVAGKLVDETSDTLKLYSGETGTVTVTCCGYTASIELTVLQDVVLSAAYLGVQDELPTAIPSTAVTADGTTPITTANPGSSLVKGDYVVLRTKGDDGTYTFVPYIWYNEQWRSAGQVPLHDSLAITGSIDDVLSVANATDSLEAYNVFTSLLVSKTALIDNLASSKIVLQSSSAGDGSIQSSDYDEQARTGWRINHDGNAFFNAVRLSDASVEGGQISISNSDGVVFKTNTSAGTTGKIEALGTMDSYLVSDAVSGLAADAETSATWSYDGKTGGKCYVNTSGRYVEISKGDELTKDLTLASATSGNYLLKYAIPEDAISYGDSYSSIRITFTCVSPTVLMLADKDDKASASGSTTSNLSGTYYVFDAGTYSISPIRLLSGIAFDGATDMWWSGWRYIVLSCLKGWEVEVSSATYTYNDPATAYGCDAQSIALISGTQTLYHLPLQSYQTKALVIGGVSSSFTHTSVSSFLSLLLASQGSYVCYQQADNAYTDGDNSIGGEGDKMISVDFDGTGITITHATGVLSYTSKSDPIKGRPSLSFTPQSTNPGASVSNLNATTAEADIGTAALPFSNVYATTLHSSFAYVGMVAYFYRLTAPDGWVVCDGASGIYSGTPLYDLFMSLGSGYYATEWKTGGRALVYDAENDCFLLDLVGNKIGNSNNTEYVGLFLRSFMNTSYLGRTESDGIRRIMGTAAMMIHSSESYQGAFETVDTGASDGNSGSTRGTRGILYFDSNGGTAETNPMRGHGTANDIHPTNIQLLPCIYTGAIV